MRHDAITIKKTGLICIIIISLLVKIYNSYNETKIKMYFEFFLCVYVCVCVCVCMCVCEIQTVAHTHHYV